MTRRAFRSIAAIVALLALSSPASAVAQRRARRQSPPRPGVSVKFATGGAAPGLPFDLIGNLILVRATVNDSAPLWFIFDTGANGTVLNTKQARALGLKSRGTVVGRASEAVTTATRFGGVRLNLPGMELTGVAAYGFDLDSFSPMFGRAVGGIIGNDVIGKFVVVIDYARRVIIFHDPARYAYAGAGHTLPLTMLDGLPFVRARLTLAGRAPLEGVFEIDTGASGALLFNGPFARKHRLGAALRDGKRTRTGGVAGSADALAGRIESVALGPFVLRDPLVRISLGRRGDNSSARYDGLLGGEIFRRFRMTVDLPRRLLHLDPNDTLHAPAEADMSGLELFAEGADFKTYFVNDVEAGSPAAEAGVREEDVLVAIDGRAAAEFSLEEIRRMFMREAGREYRLTLRRGEAAVEVKLKLRRLV